MKLVVVFMLSLCALVFQTAIAQDSRISINLVKAPISKVLQTIEEKTNYKFVYANDFFPAANIVTLRVQRTPVSDILSRLLLNTGFTFRMSQDLIIITSTSQPHEKKTITGRVTAVTGEPIHGVTVTAGAGNEQTATNDKGEYTIGIADSDVLIFSSVGFITEKMRVGDRQEANMVLKETVQDLNEVIMVGFGQRKKQDVTGSISMIGQKQLGQSQSLSPQMAMQGQIPGVSVISGGSNPTARPIVRIRGVNTFSENGAADPLYIIDGIPLVEGGAGATVDRVNDPTRRGPINLYTLINPNDIESITVLKDASAAIYGVRAANGVVLITTKSGKKGKVQVDLNMVYGKQRVPKKYDVLQTNEYVKFYTDAYNANPDMINGNAVPVGEAREFGHKWDPDDQEYIGREATYDWQDAIINKNSSIKNYHLRASGGTEHALYNFSLGYSSNDGPFIGYRTNRYSIGTNIVTHIGKYMEAGMNLRGVQQTTMNPSGDDVDVNMNVWRAPPWQKIYDVNGPLGYAPLWELNAPVTPEIFDKSSLYSQQYVAYRNVFGLLATNENNTGSQTGLGTAYLQVQPLPGLRIKGTLSAQQTSLSVESWHAFDRWWFGENPINPYSNVVNPQEGTKPGLVAIANSATISLIRSFNIDYQKKWDKNSFHVTLDASTQEYRWTGNGAGRAILNEDPNLRYFSVTGRENGFYELRTAYALIGYMARVNYHYHNRYYAEAVVRRDGTSRFAPGNQWGTFPSVVFGWRISNESFLRKLSFINDLKLRGGYGALGNEQTTGGWSYLSVAGVVRPSYNLGNPQVVYPGAAFSNFPNRDLTWEKLRSGNIGFDAVLFNNRLAVTVDYYHKVTNGIIQSVQLNPSTGITVPADINIARVLNRGMEFQVAYTRSFGNLSANINANLTTVHNEVLALANHTALRTMGLEEGLPIGFIYGYQANGIFQSQKEIDEWNLRNTDVLSREQKPGDMYFKDLYGPKTPGSTAHNLNRDSVVDENDRTYIGKTIPGYYFGFNAGVNYRSFDFSVFFQGIGNVQKYNADRAAGENMNGYGRNQWSSVLHAWTEANPGGMPRAVYNDPNQNNRVSSRFVENAGYVRLQNVQVGYTLPEKWLGGVDALKKLRLYISGINLFTITRYSGLDPEDDAFPNTRQILFGLNASF